MKQELHELARDVEHSGDAFMERAREWYMTTSRDVEWEKRLFDRGFDRRSYSAMFTCLFTAFGIGFVLSRLGYDVNDDSSAFPIMLPSAVFGLGVYLLLRHLQKSKIVEGERQKALAKMPADHQLRIDYLRSRVAAVKQLGEIKRPNTISGGIEKTDGFLKQLKQRKARFSAAYSRTTSDVLAEAYLQKHAACEVEITRVAAVLAALKREKMQFFERIAELEAQIDAEAAKYEDVALLEEDDTLIEAVRVHLEQLEQQSLVWGVELQAACDYLETLTTNVLTEANMDAVSTVELRDDADLTDTIRLLEEAAERYEVPEQLFEQNGVFRRELATVTA